jgi:hypothetical protein
MNIIVAGHHSLMLQLVFELSPAISPEQVISMRMGLMTIILGTQSARCHHSRTTLQFQVQRQEYHPECVPLGWARWTERDHSYGCLQSLQRVGQYIRSLPSVTCLGFRRRCTTSRTMSLHLFQ